MNFGEAIDAMNNLQQVYRKSWNGIRLGIDMYIEKVVHEYDSQMIYMDYIRMIYLGEHPKTIFGWLASQEDIFAEDWQIRHNITPGQEKKQP